jgi:phenylalanine-4-hydroxylase
MAVFVPADRKLLFFKNPGKKICRLNWLTINFGLLKPTKKART